MQSKVTGLAACLFTAGVATLFFSLYHDGSSRIAAAGFIVLAAAVVAWSYAAYLDGKSRS